MDLEYERLSIQEGRRRVEERDRGLFPRSPGRPSANPLARLADIRAPFGLKAMEQEVDQIVAPPTGVWNPPQLTPIPDIPRAMERLDAFMSDGQSRDLKPRGFRLENSKGDEVNFEQLAFEALKRRREELRKQWKDGTSDTAAPHISSIPRGDRVDEYLRSLSLAEALNAVGVRSASPEKAPGEKSNPSGKSKSKPKATPAPVQPIAGSRRKSRRNGSGGSTSREASRDRDTDAGSTASSSRGGRRSRRDGDGSGTSSRRRRGGRPPRITINEFKIVNGDARTAYENFLWDVTAARVDNDDDKILPYALEALTGKPGEVARTVDPPITLEAIMARLKEFYGEVSSFISTSRDATNLRKGENETVSEFGVSVMNNVSRMLRTFPAHMQDSERNQCLKETLFLGLPPNYQSQLAHLKDNPERTFEEMFQLARTIEDRIAAFRRIHGIKKDPKANNGGFGKTYNLPNRQLKGTTVPNRSANPEPSTEEFSEFQDFEETEREDPEAEKEREIQYHAECLARAAQASFDLNKHLKQGTGTPSNMECYICGGPHSAKDCPHRAAVKDFLKGQGLLFLGKGGANPPSSNTNPRPKQ